VSTDSAQSTPRLLLLVLLAGLLPGQVTYGQRRAAPEVAAPPDVERVALRIRPDLPARRLRLTATLDIANPARDTAFTFLLADWYDTVRVRSRAGPATATRRDGVVEVRVVRADPGEQLVFELSGAPGQSGGDDRPVLADSSIYLLWSDRFYPADFDDWAVVATEIEVPRGFRILAPGQRVSADDRGSVRVERYETTRPIRMATVIADARWVETERVIAGWSLRALLHPASQGYAERILSTSADVLEFYASRFGPYAFDGFTFATVEGIYARRAVAGGVIYSPAYLAQEFDATGHDAHETALQWWFYTTAGRGPGAYQWTEGFGDYAELLYDEARGLPVPPIFERYRQGYLRIAGTADEPPITAPRGPQGGNVVHGRLPWLMHLLRFAVGDSAFARGTRLVFDRWRFRSFTLDELVATLAEGAGTSLDCWRREWLDRGGVPELAWQSSVAPGAGGFLVTVTVEQTGALYHLPLEIGIETAQGLRLVRAQLDDRSVEFRFASESEPVRILVDPRRWLLARITAR
jgi:hypothetical protein